MSRAEQQPFSLTFPNENQQNSHFWVVVALPRGKDFDGFFFCSKDFRARMSVRSHYYAQRKRKTRTTKRTYVHTYMEERVWKRSPHESGRILTLPVPHMVAFYAPCDICACTLSRTRTRLARAHVGRVVLLHRASCVTCDVTDGPQPYTHTHTRCDSR